MSTSERIFNFGAGPAVLPLSVLQQVQKELLNFNGTGMSIMEISHRSKAYEAVHNETQSLMKKILNLPDNYHVLFLGGGASLQFAMVPLNFLGPGEVADYIVTGSWSEKALKEAKKIGNTNIAASSEATNFNRIPKKEEFKFSPSPVYVHITSNNTIFGTQWPSLDNICPHPLVADMSSDILSRPFDATQFSLIYAGAQKNLGPAGVTVVIVSDEMLAKAKSEKLPTMLKYSIHVENNSLYNTPPVFAIYVVNLVLKWILDNGGLAAMEKRNREKANVIYEAIDNSGGFYRGHAEKDSRSLMNVTFNLPNEELEKKFVAEAKQVGLDGLKGHRSVGGIRASIYNAMEYEGCRKLAEFMADFQKKIA